MSGDLEELKDAVRDTAKMYPARLDRSRRLFIENRAASLSDERDIEYQIKADISEAFEIPYGSVCFAGSGQLGFSPVHDRLFDPLRSDLDVACLSGDLFQRAWMDAVEVSRAFTNRAAFGVRGESAISSFKQNMVRRGMIRIDDMPISPLSREWRQRELDLSRKFSRYFKEISVAIYLNEYAFCWKQDSAVQTILK